MHEKRNTRVALNATDDYKFYKKSLCEFGIPRENTTYYRLMVNGIEALCMFLDHFIYFCCSENMIPIYVRPVSQFSIIFNEILNIMYGNINHLENHNQA